MNKKTRWGVLGFAAIVILLAVYGFWPERVSVEIQPVVRATMEVTLEEEGRTRVIDRFVVGAPVPGYTPRLALEVGDTVSRGQVLLELEPLRSVTLDPRSRAEAEARVAATRAALNAAQETVRAAEADTLFVSAELKRIHALFASGSATRQTLDQAETAYRRARAQYASATFGVEIARHELDAARTALSYAGTGGGGRRVAIPAPVGGQVLAVHQRSEGVVQPGQPLLELGDARALEVTVDVLSSDAVRIPPGTEVVFDRWGGPSPLRGIVRTVQPVGFTKVSALGVEEQRVFVVADLSSPREDWQRLGDGYRVIARFILWRGEDVLQVPMSALFRNGNGWAVFVVHNGKAVLRPVEFSHQNGSAAAVASGLEEGDEVIVHPGDSIADGTRVSIREP